MLISLTTPCMNRTHDLKAVMPSRILAASASPPVEIVIVNYNSRDDLDKYVNGLDMPEGVSLSLRHYRRREYWHMAHGFNLAVLAAKGEYFWLLGCDVFMAPHAVAEVRRLIEKRGDVWMHAANNSGNIVCRKDAFVAVGGYDERFEFYGQEGLELNERMERNGYQRGLFSNSLLRILPTDREAKTSNYRFEGGNKTIFSRMMRPIYWQCQDDEVMTANEGKDWGRWE